MAALLGCALGLAPLIASASGADAHHRLARTLSEQGRHEEALEEIQVAIDERPDYAPWHLTRGTILRHLGKYEAALGAFDRAIVRSGSRWVQRDCTADTDDPSPLMYACGSSAC